MRGPIGCSMVFQIAVLGADVFLAHHVGEVGPGGFQLALPVSCLGGRVALRGRVELGSTSRGYLVPI